MTSPLIACHLDQWPEDTSDCASSQECKQDTCYSPKIEMPQISRLRLQPLFSLPGKTGRECQPGSPAERRFGRLTNFCREVHLIGWISGLIVMHVHQQFPVVRDSSR